MGTSDVLKVLKIARVTINYEMHEQVHTIFYFNILDKITPSRYSARLTSIFGFTFRLVAHVCQTFNQVCVAFNVFLFFAFSLSFSTMFWFDKENRLSAIFFL